MAEIFYNGKIYVGALSKHEYENVFNEGSDKLWVEYLNEIPDIRKYPIIGTHSFKDGQDVTGLWTVQYQCQCGRKEKHTINHCENVVMVAVPKSTTPPDELDKEAKDYKEEVVSIIASALYNIRNTSGHPLMDTGKCDEVAYFIYADLTNEFTLKQKIEAL